MRVDLMHPADQLIMIMQRIYERGLTTTSGGNLSIMDDNGDIWITPSGIDKGSLTRADIMQVKPDGTILGRHTPSVELPFHAHIYSIRPDVKAVLHAHPPTLVAYSLARKIPAMNLQADLKGICGDVVMADYEVPGSKLLGEYIAKRFQEGYSTVMMENHGCVIGHKSILEAYHVFEALDFAGRMEMNAKKIGTPKALSDGQIGEYAAACETPFGALEQSKPTSEECALRRDLCAFAKRAYEQSLFTAAQGAFSARLADGSFLITPADGDLRLLEPEDIVRVQGNACEAGKKPGCAAVLFAQIYAEHPEVSSIAQTFAPGIMAFAATDAQFDSRTIPESYIKLRSVGRVPYMTGAQEISGLICTKTPVVLVENECAVVTGKNLTDAFDILEVLEYSAKAVVMTADIAPLIRISDKEVHDIEVAFNL
ncbi:MAG: class II aldolase/adducin family protein [Eubacteriales bacterium]|nr:class II aldolase/adducin family protein [Eubacteriales bacterium]